MVIAQKKESLFTFWKRARFEGGERETDLPPSLCDIHPSRQRQVCFVPQSTVTLLSCHGINAFSLYSQGMHSTVPPQTCLFWVVCQQDVPPKRAWAGAAKQIFSPLLTTKPYPPYLLPLAHGPTTSYIGWVQAGGAWALRVLPFQMCPRVCLLLMRLP